jgi:hypothetical protein
MMYFSCEDKEPLDFILEVIKPVMSNPWPLWTYQPKFVESTGMYSSSIDSWDSPKKREYIKSILAVQGWKIRGRGINRFVERIS